MQTFRATVHMWADGDDNTYLGSSTNDETYWHDEPMRPYDWASCGELVDIETNDAGEFSWLRFERFGTEYDRNAGVMFPVLIQTVIERVPSNGE
jgi:hypothetical protein